jgi:signal transduction histidine kinase
VALGIAIWRDVTTLRELEQSREFVYLISHDLRNPLTLIIGYSQQLLRLSLVAGRTRKSVESILTASQRMQAMIEELVESARLESGHITLNRTSLDLATAVGNLVTGMNALAEAPRIHLIVDQKPPLVFADQNRIERVVTNLIDNGLKYSVPPSEVVVRIIQRDDEIVTSVTDLGQGIPPEALSHLFEPFYRADLDRPQPQQGLGLGLYISKGMIEAHGGKIWATSEVDQGTTVSFTLPIFRS